MVSFLKQDIVEQRKQMEQRAFDLFSSFQDVIEKANHDKQLMVLVITTLDGIITGLNLFI